MFSGVNLETFRPIDSGVEASLRPPGVDADVCPGGHIAVAVQLLWSRLARESYWQSCKAKWSNEQMWRRREALEYFKHSRFKARSCLCLATQVVVPVQKLAWFTQSSLRRRSRIYVLDTFRPVEFTGVWWPARRERTWTFVSAVASRNRGSTTLDPLACRSFS